MRMSVVRYFFFSTIVPLTVEVLGTVYNKFVHPRHTMRVIPVASMMVVHL